MELTVEKLITHTESVKLDIIEATLPSKEEVKLFPKDLLRYSTWWWLRSPGFVHFRAACVDHGGSVYRSGFYIDCISVAVRPILRLANLNDTTLKIGDKFVFNGKIFQIVSDDIAFCLEDIGTSRFNKDYMKKPANDYEKSDIKEYIERWFNAHD